MKSNPAAPGGLLTSKPTRSNTSRYLTASVFLFLRARAWLQLPGRITNGQGSENHSTTEHGSQISVREWR